ncbi:hypothetical protein ADUPG1_012218 [Aduncisulcus paluster]|uniref:Uncharacterized protein n=1 Tax=Aduncisulcus paluster TaxID=2918883 RepID=A0ABQ5K0J6_9EUKA|nr:hypothetical protein ADUPG1_012218 [Aduncisulcus paluster]
MPRGVRRLDQEVCGSLAMKPVTSPSPFSPRNSRPFPPVTQLYLSVDAAGPDTLAEIDLLSILSTRQERTAIRITVIKKLNCRREDIPGLLVCRWNKTSPWFLSFFSLANVPWPDQCVEYARWLEAALEGDYMGCQCPPREQGCAYDEDRVPIVVPYVTPKNFELYALPHLLYTKVTLTCHVCTVYMTHSKQPLGKDESGRPYIYPEPMFLRWEFATYSEIMPEVRSWDPKDSSMLILAVSSIPQSLTKLRQACFSALCHEREYCGIKSAIVIDPNGFRVRLQEYPWRMLNLGSGLLSQGSSRIQEASCLILTDSPHYGASTQGNIFIGIILFAATNDSSTPRQSVRFSSRRISSVPHPIEKVDGKILEDMVEDEYSYESYGSKESTKPSESEHRKEQSVVSHEQRGDRSLCLTQERTFPIAPNPDRPESSLKRTSLISIFKPPFNRLLPGISGDSDSKDEEEEDVIKTEIDSSEIAKLKFDQTDMSERSVLDADFINLKSLTISFGELFI